MNYHADKAAKFAVAVKVYGCTIEISMGKILLMSDILDPYLKHAWGKNNSTSPFFFFLFFFFEDVCVFLFLLK